MAQRNRRNEGKYCVFETLACAFTSVIGCGKIVLEVLEIGVDRILGDVLG